jgi:hypothetical protein
MVEREMGSCAVIGCEVRDQEAAPMPLAEHDDLVQAVAS